MKIKLPAPDKIINLSSEEFQKLRESANEAGEHYPLTHFGFPKCAYPMDRHRAAFNRSVLTEIYETLALSTCNQPIDSYAQLLNRVKFFPCFGYSDELYQINYDRWGRWTEQENASLQHFISDSMRAINLVISARSHEPVDDYLPVAMDFFKKMPDLQEIDGKPPRSCISSINDILLDFAADFDRLLPLAP
jgi:hypothetical protein